MSLYRNWIHKRERYLTLLDTNRRVFPFEWGLEWIGAESDHAKPQKLIGDYAERWLNSSDDFLDPPPLTEWEMEDNTLVFPSPIPGPYPENNHTYFRVFSSESSPKAVLVVPQWNADRQSHVTLCKLLRRMGITCLRMSLPFHEQRRIPGMARADYMVSPNVGRTLSATRQAVLEVRQAVQWLRLRGYERIGIIGTSIGSCVAYLSYVHDPGIHVGVFNHVSAYFADVVWKGLATRYVRWGLEGHTGLEDLRRCWAPISPYYYVQKLKQDPRKHLLITARYDLTFLPELSQVVFDRYEKLGVPYQRVELPCGHYTTAHFPYKYLDGWYICRYFHRHL